ncbi:beta-carotene 15,15'-monooxygenase [Chryseobacterium arthrosphaerae]|uniref:Beta-carotene 15,15'-monooxygenase n=1 Tax=Chryseobacterium arthrosphaerae TaxID=651561 RepID=A0A1B8ZTW7_9FLAO|nr:beta-carotene 15,15'-monooxygenase [Chryseobacterium arthrosphaerae]AYZ13467.1 beta-carotene 15,15'-monooxygenase [Chryseobacterium arthrosphaerae]MDG4651495.1 beta-carotene 15,15'-monooxygenase [Chryseobacterium arthrosphaerae]OCA75036.1 beta-carotene 15,15'-monooxygenase [Chryseobacterium arthrosphaerae]QUY54294.1 beta-carotene 15,15'-monooxygenase [Chryseobacterium arthrosphaerae]RTZ49736.1 beta-carotene 15,15'-monooxygenase [Chryseobacterium arthrosphaerae]
MPEFDLDSFKKTWQEQPVQPKYDNREILQMLNRKSRNYVKYIFWISVVEFLFFSVLGLFYFFQEEESDSFRKVLERLGAQEAPEVENNFGHAYLAIKIMSLLITAYFVLKFYQNYRRIKIEENLKGLITRIIKFKKTVNAFILISIVLLLTFTFVLISFIFYTLSSQNIQPTNANLTIIIAGITISTLLAVSMIWVYYRLVYGSIIKKLDKNLKQLKEIDSQEN